MSCDAKPFWGLCADITRWYQSNIIYTRGRITTWKQLIHFPEKHIYLSRVILESTLQNCVNVYETWRQCDDNSRNTTILHNFLFAFLALNWCTVSHPAVLFWLLQCNFPPSTHCNLLVTTQPAESVLRRDQRIFIMTFVWQWNLRYTNPSYT